MTNEPLVTTGVITAIVAAFLTLLRAFGIPLTDEQQSAINQFLAVLSPIIVAMIARSYVTPLSRPRDQDGTTLSRPGDVPAIKEFAQLQSEAIEIDKASEGVR